MTGSWSISEDMTKTALCRFSHDACDGDRCACACHLTPEQQALSDRELARMAEPGYRDRLVDPPADLLPRPEPQAGDITDAELAIMHERSLGPGPLCSDARRLIAALRASREELRAVMDTGTETITELSRDLKASRVELALVRSERDTARGEAAREYDRAEASRADVERLRDQRGEAVEAMRLCMKDLQEYGVIFAPGDPPYDVLLAYDEESRL